jgi:phosphoglycerate kinase
MPKFLTMDDLSFRDKTVLVRVDFNSPVDLETKEILDDTRIRVHAETLRELAHKGGRVVILAHQGRPGRKDFVSLRQHAEVLSEILDVPVEFVDDVFGDRAQESVKGLRSGEVLVLDNVRKYEEEMSEGSSEEQSKKVFVRSLGPLADVFVNDAFAAAHRAHVSMVGFAAVLPSVAGRVMERELKALGRVLESPEKPCVFVLGGAKADDCLRISEYVLESGVADYVLTGGVAGHVFLVAQGFDLGQSNMSLLEKMDLMGLVPGIKRLMSGFPGMVEAPVDLAVEVNKGRKEISVGDLPTSYSICDIGVETVRRYSGILEKAKSIVVSGPVGVFENKKFRFGTQGILESVARSDGFSLVGGGHTVAAVGQLGLADKMSYVSTAGGALIEFLMGERLPAVVALEEAASRF